MTEHKMKQADKIQAIAERLTQALTAHPPAHSTAQDLLQWIEKQNPKFAAALEARPTRTANTLNALDRAIRAARAWQREGKPGPLYARLKPAARQLQAALR